MPSLQYQLSSSTSILISQGTYLQTLMVNLRLHTEDINKDFSALYFALYMEGEWGIEVGYNVPPAYITNMQKRLCDYQNLCADDCHHELFLASQGSVDYNCCPSGQTKITGSTQVNCCPEGMVYNSVTGFCYTLTGSVGVPTIDCPCCPAGYTYNSLAGTCMGVSAADVVLPIPCEPRCVDGAGNTQGLVACPDLVADSVILQYPTLDTTGCSTTTVRPWDGVC